MLGVLKVMILDYKVLLNAFILLKEKCLVIKIRNTVV